MYWAAFTILMFFYWLCSLRTNVVYALMFSTIFPGVACVCAVFFHASEGEMSKAHDCQVVSRAVMCDPDGLLTELIAGCGRCSLLFLHIWLVPLCGTGLSYCRFSSLYPTWRPHRSGSQPGPTEGWRRHEGEAEQTKIWKGEGTETG